MNHQLIKAFWRGWGPENHQHLRAEAEKIRIENWSTGRSFSRRFRRGDVEIRRPGFLPRLPESHLRKFAQIPRQRPRIRGHHGDARLRPDFPVATRLRFAPAGPANLRPCAHRHTDYFRPPVPTNTRFRVSCAIKNPSTIKPATMTARKENLPVANQIHSTAMPASSAIISQKFSASHGVL